MFFFYNRLNGHCTGSNLWSEDGVYSAKQGKQMNVSVNSVEDDRSPLLSSYNPADSSRYH